VTAELEIFWQTMGSAAYVHDRDDNNVEAVTHRPEWAMTIRRVAVVAWPSESVDVTVTV
jgi:hypothetical protein